ncbi:MAG: transketolase [Rhizobiaceae bacterium]|nr:transketolase [Rhizobiaceae bacterium]
MNSVENIDRDFATSAVTAPVVQGPIYGEALVELGQQNPDVFCLSGDLTPATEANLFRDQIPERFLNFGIAEANMIGAAGGIARSGGIPVVHSFSVFLTRRAYDQVAMQVAYPRTNVKLAGFLPGLTTLLGVSHQAIDDVALMRALPNMTIIEPADADELRASLFAAAKMNGPVYLRLRRADLQPIQTQKPRQFEIGKGQLVRDGNDAVIFASGMMVSLAVQAAELLQEKGISAAVANIHTIKPLDVEFVTSLVRDRRLVIAAENHSIIGGLGSAVCEAVAEAGLGAVVERVGIRDVFAEGGTTAYLFQKYGLSAEAIVDACLRAEMRAGKGKQA